MFPQSDTIILDVVNVRARLPAGCAPAAAQAVVQFYRCGRPPPQEQIAKAAGWHPQRGTSSDGLARALDIFLGRSSLAIDCTHPTAAVDHLRRGAPIIVFVTTGQVSAGHAVVFSGIVCDGSRTFAVVCDPMLASDYRIFVTFRKLQAAAVGGLTYEPN